MKKQRIFSKIHYILIPVAITFLTLFYDGVCKDLFCASGGRGLPVPFYESYVYWPFFLFDLVVWFVLYGVFLILMMGIVNLTKALRKGNK